MKNPCLALLLQALAGPALAQSGQVLDTAPVLPEMTLPASVEAAPAAALTLAARTPVVFELLQPVSTRTAKTGDRFELRVSEPVLVSGQLVIPVGSPALGEVIHAQKGGLLGKPGELLLTVRHIETGGQKIPMRLFQPRQARDRTNAAMATSIAVGVFAFFIQGAQIEVPAGTEMTAVVARDTLVPAPATAPSATHPKEEGSTP